jgi:hypothetical protein
MRPLDTEDEGMAFETNRFNEDQYLMDFGREDSKETEDWMEKNAVLPPPDSPITEAVMGDSADK